MCSAECFPVIVGKAQGTHLETFPYGLLKTELHRWHFLGMFRVFLEKLFHKAPLNYWLGKVQLLIVPWVGLHKIMCQSVIGKLL